MFIRLDMDQKTKLIKITKQAADKLDSEKKDVEKDRHHPHGKETFSEVIERLVAWVRRE